jgi:hypothetical protein
MPDKILITPKTKVGELLDAYPELESVLISMSPAFEKLRNPVLRKTVARVATLQQVAVVGGLKADEIVGRLRKEVGQTESVESSAESAYLNDIVPDWFDKSKVVETYDASPVINSGASPMAEILRRTKVLNQGDIFELMTPFVPAPILDMLRTQGFKVWCIQNGPGISSFIQK